MSKDEVSIILQNLEILFPNASCELIYHNLFELLIAVSLSAQTTDKAVNKVTPALFSAYPDAFSLSQASQTDVQRIIKTIGLSHNKSKNIIALSKILIEKYQGEVPKEQEKLESLPGVGRKTANVILTEGYHIPRLPVDTHVERVSKRMGIVNQNASVLQVELKLMELIDESKWHQAHHLFLFMGRYKCLAKNPKCSDCFYKNKCKYDKKPLE